jgi:hypothetical protein
MLNWIPDRQEMTSGELQNQARTNCPLSDYRLQRGLLLTKIMNLRSVCIFITIQRDKRTMMIFRSLYFNRTGNNNEPKREAA